MRGQQRPFAAIVGRVVGGDREECSNSDLTRSPEMPLVADRPLARAGAWYEMVPRSQGSVPGRHGTFDDCIARLPEIAALGFDVALSAADPSDRPHQPQGTQQCA